MKKVITIDGPVASGKSTLGFLLAKELDYYHLNSGLLFRALAYILVRHGGYTKKNIDLLSAQDIQKYGDSSRLEYRYDYKGVGKIFFEGTDITAFLKTEAVDDYSSLISTSLYVRDVVLAMQRELAQKYNLIVDGRDTGSVVFPHAFIKFFLTASLECRAIRWQNDQKKQGNESSLAQAIEAIKDRDTRDENRKIAPLIIPEDAVYINNTNFDINQTLRIMLEEVVKKQGHSSE